MAADQDQIQSFQNFPSVGLIITPRLKKQCKIMSKKYFWHGKWTSMEQKYETLIWSAQETLWSWSSRFSFSIRLTLDEKGNVKKLWIERSTRNIANKFNHDACIFRSQPNQHHITEKLTVLHTLLTDFQRIKCRLPQLM